MGGGRTGRGRAGEAAGPPLTPCSAFPSRMGSVGEALERLLAAAQRQGCLTVGVYEAAKLMNA